MKGHGTMNSGSSYKNTLGTHGVVQRAKRRVSIVAASLRWPLAGPGFLSIVRPLLICLGGLAAGLVLTSCSATVGKLTSFGGLFQRPDHKATSVSSSGTLPLTYQQLPTAPPNVVSLPTTSKAPSSVTFQPPVGSVSVIPKCPRTIPGPQPLPEWAAKLLYEMQARGLNK